MVGFFRISVSGFASDFLEESADWKKTEVIKIFSLSSEYLQAAGMLDGATEGVGR